MFKFELGQKVWFVANPNPKSKLIDSGIISNRTYEDGFDHGLNIAENKYSKVEYWLHDLVFEEHELFSSEAEIR